MPFLMPYGVAGPVTGYGADQMGEASRAAANARLAETLERAITQIGLGGIRQWGAQRLGEYFDEVNKNEPDGAYKGLAREAYMWGEDRGNAAAGQLRRDETFARIEGDNQRADIREQGLNQRAEQSERGRNIRAEAGIKSREGLARMAQLGQGVRTFFSNAAQAGRTAYTTQHADQRHQERLKLDREKFAAEQAKPPTVPKPTESERARATLVQNNRQAAIQAIAAGREAGKPEQAMQAEMIAAEVVKQATTGVKGDGTPASAVDLFGMYDDFRGSLSPAQSEAMYAAAMQKIAAEDAAGAAVAPQIAAARAAGDMNAVVQALAASGLTSKQAEEWAIRQRTAPLWAAARILGPGDTGYDLKWDGLQYVSPDGWTHHIPWSEARANGYTGPAQ